MAHMDYQPRLLIRILLAFHAVSVIAYSQTMSPYIIPGFPEQNSLRFWVGSAIMDRTDSRLLGKLVRVADNVKVDEIRGEPLHLGRPEGKRDSTPIAILYRFSKLTPGTAYRFEINGLSSQIVRTLPARLDNIDPFKFAAGSCYWYFGKNGKTIGDAYPLEATTWDNKVIDDYRPDARMLVGDQIYADVFQESGERSPLRMRSLTDSTVEDLFHYVAYKDQWADTNFLKFLSRTPTGVLADDHELWNGYPRAEGFSPWTSDVNNRHAVDNAARATFNTYQASLNPGGSYTFTFAIEPLSFFVIDSWMYKEVDTPHGIYSPRDLDSLKTWLQNLTGPGVIVSSSPILTLGTGPVKGWGNIYTHDPLGSYQSEIDAIWKALATCRHDVLLVGGDIHYTRLGYADVGPWRRRLQLHGTIPDSEMMVKAGEPGRTDTEGRVYECISSPLSVVTLPVGRVRQTIVTPCLLFPFPFRFYCAATASLEGNVEPQIPYYPIGSILTARKSGHYSVFEFRRSGSGVLFRVHHFPTEKVGSGSVKPDYSSPEFELR
jgi:hypothetical protein